MSNTYKEDEIEYIPAIEDSIAVSRILAFDLKQVKKEVASKGIEWITELGRKTSEELWPDDCVYWNGAKVQVVKSQRDANRAFGYSRRRVITKHPNFVAGLFCIVARKMQANDLFVLENLDNILRFELFHTIADYIDNHKVKTENDISVNYVNDFLDYFISFTEHFYAIKPLVEEKLFDEFKTSNFNNFYFAYGSNIDPKQMQERCPGAIPVGIGNLPFYKTIINSRGVATIINAPDSFASGILWSVSDEHIKTLDEKEGVRFGTYARETKTIRINSLEIHAITYVASKTDQGKPREGYLEKLINGANHFSFGDEFHSYIQSLK